MCIDLLITYIIYISYQWVIIYNLSGLSTTIIPMCVFSQTNLTIDFNYNKIN